MALVLGAVPTVLHGSADAINVIEDLKKLLVARVCDNYCGGQKEGHVYLHMIFKPRPSPRVS